MLSQNLTAVRVSIRLFNRIDTLTAVIFFQHTLNTTWSDRADRFWPHSRWFDSHKKRQASKKGRKVRTRPRQMGPSTRCSSMRPFGALLPVLFFERGNGNPDSRHIWNPLMGSTIQGRVTSPSEDIAQARATMYCPPQRSIYATYCGHDVGLHTPNTCDRSPAGT